MTKVPGAAEELERGAAWLVEEVRSLVVALTGGPAPNVPVPQPHIATWDEPLRFGCTVTVQQVPLPPAPEVDPIEAGHRYLAAAGWKVRPLPPWIDVPINVVAQHGEFMMTLVIPEARDVLGVTATTPGLALYEPRDPNATADCPRCGQAMTPMSMSRKRHEVWWACRSCSWLGYQAHEGERLLQMLRLEGEDADCYVCGEGANVASPPVEKAGYLEDWLVCLACGTSNPRRYRSTEA